MGGNPFTYLGAEGVDELVAQRVLELAAEQHEQFVERLLNSIEACVQNGVARAFGGH